MNQTQNTTMQERPITAVCVIENAANCPNGFTIISKTHDADVDADLWKESSIFGRRTTRYLCVSWSSTSADYILENLAIINEKELPPIGFATLARTTDTDQKAWRKKQLCFKLTRQSVSPSVITEIILLSKNKRAPHGFALVGDLNGIVICCKQRLNNPSFDQNITYDPTSSIINGDTDMSHGLNVTKPVNGYAHNYENIGMSRPSRPAPAVPPHVYPSSKNSVYKELESIPFKLNDRLDSVSKCMMKPLPVFKIKTKEDIDKEYHHDFKLEKFICSVE